MPFQGFPPGPATVLDQTEKLQKIIENLNKQQDIVRANIATLYKQRADDLRSKAKEALESMPPYEEDPVQLAKREADLEAIIQGMKLRAVKGENYEFRISDKRSDNTNKPDGDVEMGGMDTNNRPTTAKQIRQALARELRDIVDESVKQLKLYDTHCAQTLRPYQDALDRRIARGEARPTPIRTASGPGPVRGILNNRNESSPIDQNAIRRMSKDMPIAGISPQKPVRNYGDMESMTRRGSGSK